jgi:hypothetical protein
VERGDDHPKRIILAAGLYADGQGEKPRELQLWEQWRKFGIPPRGGGLLDQPAGLLERIEIVRSVYDAVRQYQKFWCTSGWMEANSALVQIVMVYWRLRDEHGQEQS